MRGTINEEMKNLAMNDKTYKLRRKVMALLYDAKKLVNLPRINIRITGPNTNNPSVIGTGGSTTIWIPERSVHLSTNDLRYIVYHEICHTVFNARHTNSGLMKPVIQYGLSKKQIDKMFIAVAKRRR